MPPEQHHEQHQEAPSIDEQIEWKDEIKSEKDNSITYKIQHSKQPQEDGIFTVTLKNKEGEKIIESWKKNEYGDWYGEPSLLHLNCAVAENFLKNPKLQSNKSSLLNEVKEKIKTYSESNEQSWEEKIQAEVNIKYDQENNSLTLFIERRPHQLAKQDDEGKILTENSILEIDQKKIKNFFIIQNLINKNPNLKNYISPDKTYKKELIEEIKSKYNSLNENIYPNFLLYISEYVKSNSEITLSTEKSELFLFQMILNELKKEPPTLGLGDKHDYLKSFDKKNWKVAGFNLSPLNSFLPEDATDDDKYKIYKNFTEALIPLMQFYSYINKLNFTIVQKKITTCIASKITNNGEQNEMGETIKNIREAIKTGTRTPQEENHSEKKESSGKRTERLNKERILKALMGLKSNQEKDVSESSADLESNTKKDVSESSADLESNTKKDVSESSANLESNTKKDVSENSANLESSKRKNVTECLNDSGSNNKKYTNESSQKSSFFFSFSELFSGKSNLFSTFMLWASTETTQKKSTIFSKLPSFSSFFSGFSFWSKPSSNSSSAQQNQQQSATV